jgi:hypothetical protein
MDWRQRYRAFVEEGISEGRRNDFTGGSLIRSSDAGKAGQRYSKDQMSIFLVMVILLSRRFQQVRSR